MSAQELVELLANSFGQPDKICSLLTEDAEWWISPPIADNIRGDSDLKEFKGLESLRKMMLTVFGAIYDPDSVAVDVHETIGADGRHGADELRAVDEVAEVLSVTPEENHLAFQQYFEQQGE